jgi:hypothetical protein
MSLTKLQGQLVDSTTNITVNNVISTGDFVVPVGTTAQRPASPSVGMIRYNTTLENLEQYNSSGWIAIAPPPIVTSISPTTFNGTSGTTFNLYGSYFDSQASVKFITNSGTEYSASTVTFVNSAELVVTTPRIFTVSEEPLAIKVINGSGLICQTAGLIDCGGTPTWQTAAGLISICYDVMRLGFSVSVSASDPDSQAITYSLVSGSLPTGTSLNTSTGVISGTPNAVVSDTTYTFTIGATDPSGNSSTREFSISVKAPVTVTYSYTGSNQSFSIPTGLTKLNAKMWGAGGGSPGNSGGAGGYSAGTITLTGLSSTFIIVVGRAGTGYGPNNSNGNFSPYGGGGNAGAIGFSGQGGGLSGIFNISVTHGNSLLIAGGGGGGGWDSGNHGGAGGGSTGQSGIGSNSGSGGTQSAGGGNGVSGAYGSALQGGSSPSSGDSGGGGGGGGGYYGGGGAYNGDSPAGNSGGGGGSGYYHPTYVTSATLTGGDRATPGNSGDSDRAGYGAPQTAGIVIIRY